MSQKKLFKQKKRQLKLELSSIIINLGVDPLSIPLYEYQERLKFVYKNVYALSDIRNALDAIVLDNYAEQQVVMHPDDHFDGF